MSRTPTMKRRKQHRRGASEMGKLFMTLFDDKKKAPVCRTTAQDAEDVTREERLSRMLHTPKPKVKLPAQCPLFDHFLVIGLQDHRATKPSVLFHYPPSPPVNIPGVEDFCFPRGVKSEKLKVSACKSNLIELTHNQQYLKHPEQAFAFLLTNEDSTVYYGVCIHKLELLADVPLYMDSLPLPEEHHAKTFRCYCLITKYPFFRLHLDFLYSLFSIEHLVRLVEDAPEPSKRKGSPMMLSRSATLSTISRSRIKSDPCDSGRRVDGKRKGLVRRGSKTPDRPLEAENGEVEDDEQAAVANGHTAHAEVINKPDLSSAGASVGDDGDAAATNRIVAQVEKALEAASDNARVKRHQDGGNGNGCTEEELPSVECNGDAASEVDVRKHEMSDEGDEQKEVKKEKKEKEPQPTGRSGAVLRRTHTLPKQRPASEIPTSEDMRNRLLAGVEPLPPKMAALRQGDAGHPSIDALLRYSQHLAPGKGQTLTFESSKYLNGIEFTRPFFDEEEELFAEWGLPLAFYLLSVKNICGLLSCILLEKKVVLLSTNLRYLSALVLSFPPLIRPFLYQSVIIPALPVKMHNFLDAPVPFVVGLTDLPPQLPDDVIVINVDKNRIISKESIPQMPGMKELCKKCTVYHDQLKKTFVLNGSKSAPWETTKEQLSLVDSISTVFETFFTKMFTNFHEYTIRNLTDASKPISVFMKDAFLFDYPDESFLTPFVETQIFFDYQDKRLRKRDKFKIPKSTEMVFSKGD